MLDKQQLLEMIDIPAKFVNSHGLFVERGGTPELNLHFVVFVDSLTQAPDGKAECYATAIDMMSSEEMVHYRIRAMFAHPPRRVGMFELWGPIQVLDHPTEAPPDNIHIGDQT